MFSVRLFARKFDFICFIWRILFWSFYIEHVFEMLDLCHRRRRRPTATALKSTVYFNRPMKCSHRSVVNFTMQLHTGANDTYILEINKPQQTLCERNNTNSVSRCYFRTLLLHKLFKIHTYTHTNQCMCVWHTIRSTLYV